MPIEFKRAYLEEIRYRYKKSTKKSKGMILDEFCRVCDLSRKHAFYQTRIARTDRIWT